MFQEHSSKAGGQSNLPAKNEVKNKELGFVDQEAKSKLLFHMWFYIKGENTFPQMFSQSSKQ